MPLQLSATNIPLDKILWASLGLVAFLIFGFLVVTQVKRRMNAGDSDPTAASGFTLSDLRELHESGQMSDEEFERAKGRVIAAARRATDRDTPKPDTRQKPPIDME
jgi:hypothetical protein